MYKILLIVLLIIFSSLIFAVNFEVISQTENELIVKFVLPEFETEMISTKLGTFSKIICADASYPVEGGHPSLPFFTEIIGLPIDGDATFQIIEKKQKTIRNLKVYPTEKMVPSETSVRYQLFMEKDIYNSSALYPVNIIIKGSKAYLGDRYFMGFNVHPFQYKAKNDELILTEELTLRIKIVGNKNRNISQGENYVKTILIK